MSDENQHFVETELDSTLNETRESEDTSDELSDLFNDESEEQDAPTREEYNRLLKGVKKLASQVGQAKTASVEVKPEQKVEQGLSTTNPVLKTLYFNANPDAKEVWDMVESDAKALGKDPFELYESTRGYKLEAKAIAEAKRVDEENRSKISKPSNGTAPSRVDVSKVKPDEISKLSPSDKVKWIQEQVKRERESAEG